MIFDIYNPYVEGLDKKAYGRKFADEAEIVAYLMEEYQRLVSEK